MPDGPAPRGPAPPLPAADAPPLRIRLPKALAALGYPNFRYLWVGLLLSNTGTWMQTVAQGWLVYQLTDSSVYLGAVGLTRAVPLLFLSLVGGATADRIDRRHLLFITNAVAGLLALALAVDTWTGAVRAWHVLLMSFLSAAVLAFDQPTRQALLPALVPREALFNAVSLNSMTFNGAGIAGSALGGALIPVAGVGGNFFLNFLSYGFVILALARMRLPDEGRRGAEAGAQQAAATSVLGDLREGIAYVRSRRVLLALLASAAGLSFFGRSYQALLPVFARDVLQAGVTGLGLLTAAPGVGTVAGALVLANLGDGRGKGRLLMGTGLGLSGVLAAFAVSRLFLPSLVFLVLSGAASILASATINTLLQLSVEDRMRGRVMSMYTFTMLGMMPLGQMPLGAAAQAIGAPLAVAFSAAASAAVVVTAAAWEPRLRRLE